MLATTKNLDIICFQIKSSYFSQLDNSLKKDMTAIWNKTKNIIISNKDIKQSFNEVLPQVFNFRIKAIKWLLADNEDNLLKMLDEVIPQIEELKANPKLKVLSENILFALRCNHRVIEAIVSGNGNISGFDENFSELPDITYQQFIASVTLGIPDNETAKKIINWTKASLYIELVTLSADIIYSDKLQLSEKVINELSFLIADAAQEYLALAIEAGILKSQAIRQTIPQMIPDNKFIKEQQQFADLGLGEYAADLLK